MNSRSIPWRPVTLCGAALAGLSLVSAPIPKLFNTGVDDTGAPLPNATVDPHYTLIESPDAGYPGPQTFTLEAGWPVAPAGPWVADSAVSRWIAPRARQSTGNAPGTYTYRTTFDLTGFDPAKARITGRWTSDDSGVDIVLNGTSLGLGQGGNFGQFYDFTIEFGFVEGTNTLDFIVFNAGDAVNPTGLRVEMVGTVEIAGEPPRLLTAPTGGTYLVGDDVTLTVVADGTPPLTYQWRRNGADLPGATEATLTLTGITLDQEGDYAVVVRNAVGELTSPSARVIVLEPLPGLFNTGVDDQGMVLFDGSEDPHYRLVVNPDDPNVTAPLVQDSTVFPIVAGPWVANSDTSTWIGPRFETSAAAGGDYLYELEVDLTGFDPRTAFIAGFWATDNAAQMLLDGGPTGVSNAGNFDTLSPFRLEGLFLTGKNKLQFRVNNAGAGYTGLRVQGLRGGARRGTAGDVPRIISQPIGGLLVTGESLTLSVLADGARPLEYQWRKNGSDLAGRTDPDLRLDNVTREMTGEYTVIIRNFAGTVTSVVAAVTVLDRVPGVFSTGVDAAGTVLPDGEMDPHYRLVVNATDPQSQDAFVHDSTIFPIVDGPWLANTDRSKWIAPLANSSTTAGGDYAYRTTFDLTGFDPATAVLMGSWATDNLGTDIKLNGVSTGLANSAQFGALTPFTLSTGFVEGVNTLEFHLSNTDPVTGYTGLRVDNLRVGARSVAGGSPSLAVRREGGNVIVSWPAGAAGYRLHGSPALGPAATWALVNLTPAAEGDRLVLTLAPTGTTQFFRLQR